MTNQKHFIQLINRSLLLTPDQKTAWLQKLPLLAESQLKKLEVLLVKSNEELFHQIGSVLQKDVKGVYIAKLQEIANRVSREGLHLEEKAERQSESPDTMLDALHQL